MHLKIYMHDTVQKLNAETILIKPFLFFLNVKSVIDFNVIV